MTMQEMKDRKQELGYSVETLSSNPWIEVQLTGSFWFDKSNKKLDTRIRF